MFTVVRKRTPDSSALMQKSITDSASYICDRLANSCQKSVTPVTQCNFSTETPVMSIYGVPVDECDQRIFGVMTGAV